MYAQSRILVFNGVDSAFVDGDTTAVNNTDTTVASLSPGFPAGDNLIIAANQLDNGSLTNPVTLAHPNQHLDLNTTVLTHSEYDFVLGGSGNNLHSRSSGLMYLHSGASANPTYNDTEKANASSQINGEAKILAISLAAPTYTQSSFRFFNNKDSLDVDVPLAATNSALDLTSTSQAFRLRMNIKVTNNQLGQSGENFKLQYADKSSSAQCTDVTDGSYADVTGSSALAYNTNAGASDGSIMTSNVQDPVDQNTNFSDSFNRADSDTIGADWTERTANGDNYQIVSNKLKLTSNAGTGTAHVAYTSTGISGADYNVQATINYPTTGDTNNWMGVVGRGAVYGTSDTNGYYVLASLSEGNVRLYKRISGSWIQLGSTISETINTGTSNNIRLSMNGTAIKAYWNDTMIISVTDSTYSAQGYAGVSYGAGGTDVNNTWDNFVIFSNGNTVNDQTYNDANNFSNGTVWIPKNQDGMWDFSLKDNSGLQNKIYCLRVVLSDGSALNTYSVFPEVTTVPENGWILFGSAPVVYLVLKGLKNRKVMRRLKIF